MRCNSVQKLVVLSCLVFAGWWQARSQTGPKIISFDVPGAVDTEPAFMNPAGVIVGQYIDANKANHGFLRLSDGTITAFDAPGAGTGSGEGTTPWSINPAGVVTGWYIDATGLTHGFVRAQDGTFSTFDAPDAGIPAGVPCAPPIICSNGTQPGSINPAGTVSGQYVDTSGVFHGFVRSSDGTITTFDAPDAGMGAQQGTVVVFGDGINSAGTIVAGSIDASGSIHSYVRAPDGTFTPFDVVGSQFIDAAGINPEGVIMGFYAGSSGPYHGFLRAKDGQITSFDISGAGTQSGQGTEPLNINAPGDITGTYVDGNGVYHGFVRLKNGAVTTFNAPEAGTSSGQGTIPFCNNPSNAITGSYIDANGVSHGFLRK